MSYLVLGDGSEITDQRYEITDTIEEAYAAADEFLDLDLDIQIFFFNSEMEDLAFMMSDIYENLYYYETFDEFSDKIPEEQAEYIEANNLWDFFKERFESKNANDIFSLDYIPQYVKVPMNKNLYRRMVRDMKRTCMSPSELLYDIVKKHYGMQ